MNYQLFWGHHTFEKVVIRTIYLCFRKNARALEKLCPPSSCLVIVWHMKQIKKILDLIPSPMIILYQPLYQAAYEIFYLKNASFICALQAWSQFHKLGYRVIKSPVQGCFSLYCFSVPPTKPRNISDLRDWHDVACDMLTSLCFWNCLKGSLHQK